MEQMTTHARSGHFHGESGIRPSGRRCDLRHSEVGAPALQREQDRNEPMTRSVLAGGRRWGLMRTNHAGAVVALALVLSACGSPGSATPSADEPSVAALASPSPPADACGAWEADASDDAVLVYFPCGSDGELHAAERTRVPEAGDERLIQILRLYLAGPSAEEREAGFSAMLAPGDIDIVEISPRRLVLDFPSEVNNVSTSAGSRAVLDGLRETFVGLSGIQEIELRLRNDCAAFFEWIQVGPTCHVLTADGLASAPAQSPAATALQVATCEHSSGAYQVDLPEGWWTNPEFEDEIREVAACRFFGPSEFDATSADRETPIPEGTAIWIDYRENTCVGYISEILTSHETTVGGYPAVVSELAFGKEEAGPPFTYEYVVTLTPDTDCESGGRYVRAVTSRDYAGDFEDNRAVLDQMMETIEIRSP